MRYSRRVDVLRKAVVLLALPAAWACGPSTPETGTPASSQESQQTLSWEEYKQRATHVVNGRELYLVEWDLPLTLEELRQRYENSLKSTSERTPERVATVESPLIVNQTSTGDDIWPALQRLSLRYCVSNEFGTQKSRVVTEMSNAAAAWERVADVDFTYVSAQDANCVGTNTAITFAVRPWIGPGACAFFPSGLAPCEARTVLMNLDFVDTDPDFKELAPNVRSSGIFTHELGHVLGFRHEHARPEGVVSPDCPAETVPWRALTPYDQGSTMHYPWCGGLSTTTLALTARDAQGAAGIYGWYTNTNNGDRRFPAAATANAITSAELGQSFRLPLTLTATYVDGCFTNAGRPNTVRIRSGESNTGTVLATSTNIFNTGVACGVSGNGSTWHRATFTGVALTANLAYTASFSASGFNMNLAYSGNNPYSGGSMYSGSTNLTTQDALVRIGRIVP